MKNLKELANTELDIKVMTEMFKFGKDLYIDWKSKHSYQVIISSNDASYIPIQKWLRDTVALNKQRSISLNAHKNHDRKIIIDSFYEGTIEQMIHIDDFKVKVSIEKPGNNSNEISSTQRYSSNEKQITFTCFTSQIQQKLITILEKVIKNYHEVSLTPELRMLSRWGEWQRHAELPKRPLESVILAEGQLENIVNDMSEFLKNEKEYVNRGLPWHRGYLFQGPPGTGKTSIAIALANHFKMDLWTISLGDLEKDTALISLCAEVKPNSILVIEDIDVYKAATSREGVNGYATLSGLLNSLDGITTPHGLITIMTSNHPDVLDDALIRPGRIDYVQDIGYLVNEQAYRLFEHFYGHKPSMSWKIEGNVSPATLMEIFKANMFSPEKAESYILNGGLQETACM